MKWESSGCLGKWPVVVGQSLGCVWRSFEIKEINLEGSTKVRLKEL